MLLVYFGINHFALSEEMADVGVPREDDVTHLQGEVAADVSDNVVYTKPQVAGAEILGRFSDGELCGGVVCRRCVGNFDEVAEQYRTVKGCANITVGRAVGDVVRLYSNGGSDGIYIPVSKFWSNVLAEPPYAQCDMRLAGKLLGKFGNEKRFAAFKDSRIGHDVYPFCGVASASVAQARIIFT